MPLCFGAFGSVRASNAPHCRVLREGGPYFLAGDSPATVDLDGLGGQTGQVRTGARLGKQLAPVHFTAQCRRQKASLLVFIAERDDGWNQKACDAQHGAPNPAGAEFLRDDDLLDRGG